MTSIVDVSNNQKTVIIILCECIRHYIEARRTNVSTKLVPTALEL